MTLDKDAANAPSSISGGCLCEAIRYTVAFNKDHPWPPVSSSCQCTMCRKWTSSLVAQFLVVYPSQFTPELQTFSHYKEYTSSPGRLRGFCNNCGTSLIWRSEEDRSTFDLYLGTIDEKCFLQEETVGKTLATPNGTQFWLENAIHGVTDLLKGGTEYQQEGADGLHDSLG